MSADRSPRRRRVSRRRSEGPWGNFAILRGAPGQTDRIHRIRIRRDAQRWSEATAGGGYRELGPAGGRAKTTTAARTRGLPLGDHRQSRVVHCCASRPYGGESSASISSRASEEIRGQRRTQRTFFLLKYAVPLSSPP